MSSIHLAIRYLVESLVLLGIAFYSAIKLAENFHEIVFVTAGFDAEFVNLNLLNPYQTAGQQVLLLILGMAALVAVMPVCLALRKPVGRVLG